MPARCPSPQTDYLVGVDLLVVPDGIAANGRLRLNVSFSPTLRKSVTPTIDLREWPVKIAGIVAGLKACIADVTTDGPAGYRDRRSVKVRLPDVALTGGVPGWRKEALALWRRLFGGDPKGGDDGFAWLWQVIHDRTAGPTADPAALVRRGTYQAEGLGKIYDQLHSMLAAQDLTRALTRRFHLDAGRQPPAGHGLDDFTLPIEFWRKLHSDWFANADLTDPVSMLMHQAAGSTVDITHLVHQDMVAYAALPVAARIRAATQNGLDARRALAAAGTMMTLNVNADPMAASPFGHPNAAQVRTEIARLKASWGLDLEPRDKGAPAGDYVPTCGENAARKFAGILAYPTLSKFLGLHSDYTMAEGALGDGTPAYGGIAAYIDEAPQKDTIADFAWTAYVRRGPAAETPDYFGPCGRDESVTHKISATQPVIDGIYNLKMLEIGSRSPRFVLDMVDPVIATTIIGDRSRQIVESDRKGSTAAENDTAIPDVSTPGIKLVDRSADVAKDQLELRIHEIETKIKDRVPLVRDAEDLCEGLRIDAALAADARGAAKKAQWRSLTARNLSYEKEPDIPHGFLTSVAVSEFPGRDDGEVRAMTARRQGRMRTNGRAVTTIFDYQVLFTWTGESLAVPGRIDPKTPSTPDDGDTWLTPEEDLALNIDIDIPDQGLGRPVPLRIGRSYMFGSRARFPNGCSVPFESAAARYATTVGAHTPLVILGDWGNPFRFERTAPIPPPDVLLPWNSRIVQQPPAKWLGETVDHLVIRTKHGDWFSPAPTQRYLSAARTTPELTEQAGTFEEKGKPAGAYDGDVGLEMDPLSGSLPLAADGKWHFPAVEKPPVGAPPPPKVTEPSRGTVAVLRANPKAPWRAYFIDPACRQVAAAFDAGEGPASDYGVLKRPLSFWGKREGPDQAMPLVVELTSKGKRRTPWAVFQEHDTVESVQLANDPDSVQLNKLTVALEVGESVDLILWSVPDQRHAKSHRYLQSGISFLRQAARQRLKSIGIRGSSKLKTSEHQHVAALASRNAKRIDAAVSALLATAPGSMVRKRILHLVHAVDKPLQTPTFALHANGKADINAVVVKGSATDSDRAALSNWATYVHGAGCLNLDQSSWPSQEGGTTAFLIGQVKFHRASTGKLRCDASWKDYGPDTLVKSIDTGEWITSPSVGSATLFSVDIDHYTGKFRNRNLDLLLNDDGELRSLFFAFKDGRARNVGLQLIATSRFTDYFPKAKTGTYDVAGPGLDKPAYTHWIPCTFRPPAPDIDRVEPVFQWNVAHDRKSHIGSFTRMTSLRVFLKSNWWASGDGEQLAVICGTKGDVGDPSMAPYVSRWGDNPAFLSPTVPSGLHLEHMTDPQAHSPIANVVRNVHLAHQPQRNPPPFPDGAEVPEACPAVPSPRPPVFTVACFDPVIQTRDGLYCDIYMDAGKSYLPYIDLRLARFQRHCAERLRISPHTELMIPVPGSRTGSIKPMSKRAVAFEYRGYGYVKSNSGDALDTDHLTRTPRLNILIVTASLLSYDPDSADEQSWQPALDPQGNPIAKLNLKPSEITADGELIWRGQLTEPPRQLGVTYGLQFDEIEWGWVDDPSMTVGTGGNAKQLKDKCTLHRVLEIKRGIFD